MRKRLLSILLLCCMVLTLLPTTALAEEAVRAVSSSLRSESAMAFF